MHKLHHYDLAVLGSGPAGQYAAMQAVKLHKKVVMIEKLSRVGGSSLHTGTIPSKSLRETVVHLGLLRQRVHGIDISFRGHVNATELMYRKEVVIDEQENTLRQNIRKTNIELIQGDPEFKKLGEVELPLQEIEQFQPEVKPAPTRKRSKKAAAEAEEAAADPKALNQDTVVLQVEIKGEDPTFIRAEHYVIATGSRPNQPTGVKCDGENILDSDTILNMKELPKKLTIVGAGVIGCEYACIFARMGIRVNLISKDYDILSFLDHEICDRLKHYMRNQRILLRFGEEVTKIEKCGDNRVKVYLKSGKVLLSSHVLIAAGRTSNTRGLGLDRIGVKLGTRGLIEVNRDNYQTTAEHIYAVGDVIGFPALASTAMLQGRIAALHAFGEFQNEKMPKDLPFGIWTIPPVAMVGKTEKELTDAGMPYEIGVAHFKEIARSHIMGEEEGILKLLFDPNTLKLLGVHIIGPRAAELIHVGQTVMSLDGTIKFFVNTVFNHPTLDEAYRVAAFNGLNRLTFDL